MKKSLFLVLGLILSCCVVAQNREIDFGKTTLEEALVQAKKFDKLIFVDCYTTYCPPCRTMDATVFKTDSVADFLNSTFINVKMNNDVKENKVYMEKYNIGAFPSFLLLDHEGKLLYKFVGGMSVDKFMEHIRSGMKPKNNVAMMNSTYASGKYTNTFLRDYIQLKLTLLEREECVRLGKEYFDRLSPRERTAPENWFLFTNRTLCEVNSPNMHYLFGHWSEFTKRLGEKMVFDHIGALCRNMMEWELQGWKYERDVNDFEFYKQKLAGMSIPCRKDYLIMMDIAKAHCVENNQQVRDLLEEHVADFSAENQKIMFAAMGLFRSYVEPENEQLKRVAKKILRSGKNSNLSRYLETFVDAEEVYGGEKYDVQALQDKIGSTAIIPFFHPTEDKFWYVLSDNQGGRQYYSYDVRRGKRALYDFNVIDSLLRQLEPDNNNPMIFYNPEFGEKEILATLSTGNKTYLYDAKKRTLTPSSPKTYRSLRPYGVSPDLRYELVVQEYDLWLKDKEQQKDRQLTFDGTEGYSFEIPDAEWLGDDGVFYITRKDNRSVRDFSVLYSCMEPTPVVRSYKYELPGDTAVQKDEIFVGNVRTGAFVKVDVVKWPGQLLEIVKVPDVKDRFFFIRKKRTRDEFELCSVDVNTGKVKVILHEVNKPYLNEELFRCCIVNQGKDIILWSDRSGWGHYYHYSGEGKLLNAITTGDWTAGRISKIDTVKKQIYFYGYGKEPGRNPNYTYFYRVNFDGKELRLLTPENATHSVYVSPSKNLLVDNFSRIDTIPQIAVRDRNGRLLTILEKPDISKLLEYGWRFPEQFVVKAADGKTDLYGIMWKPYDFDSTRVYPIISQVYPGPQTETVWTEFTVFDRYNNTALAQRGFIVVCMGHRGGSPFRDKAYATYGYGNLRDYPLADDKYGLEQLGRRYSFIDTTRVGIYGHSGGGMMAVSAICTYPDFYKVAVASSGNHDNRIYNRTWGETYQGIGDDNHFTVDINQTLVKDLRGHLLLVTGEVDQNVHPANTLRIVNALIQHNKDFDLLILPNQGHSYEGLYKTYFERKKRDYFTQYLLGN